MNTWVDPGKNLVPSTSLYMGGQVKATYVYKETFQVCSPKCYSFLVISGDTGNELVLKKDH